MKMMQNEIEKEIHRILISLDFDDYSSSFIEALVTLASQTNADLCGLFFEESELQQVANLPFSREITFPTAHIRELNSDFIARHLEQHAASLRKMMEDFSRLSNVPCSFKTAKTAGIETILSESYDFQLVALLPKKYSSLKNKPPAGLEELINPTILLYDGSRQAQKAAYIVKSLADSGKLHQLKILTMDRDSEVTAKEQFSFADVEIDYQHLDSYKIENIISLPGLQKSGLLILPLEDCLIGQNKAIREMLDVLGFRLLLVR